MNEESELFMDMMKKIQPSMEGPYEELTFHFEKDDNDFEVIVSYKDPGNGARIELPYIDGLEQPVSRLVELSDGSGRGILRRGSFVVTEEGQVKLEIEYDKV